MSYTLSIMVRFLWLQLTGIFGVVSFAPNLCKEYLDVATGNIQNISLTPDKELNILIY